MKYWGAKASILLNGLGYRNVANHHHWFEQSPEETLDLVNYYLASPTAAENRSSRAGRGYRKHTYQQRVREIMLYLQEFGQTVCLCSAPGATPSPAPVQVQVSHPVAVQPSPVHLHPRSIHCSAPLITTSTALTGCSALQQEASTYKIILSSDTKPERLS